MSHALQRELDVAERVAREAGRIILEVYRTDFAVEYKPSEGGPVTEADARANELIVSELRRAFPGDGVIAEESVDPAEVQKSARCWFVDPLDGTAEFVDKNGMFAVHIGLAVEGVPQVGVVYAPAADKLYAGIVGQGCELEDGNGRRAIRVSGASEPKQMRLVVSRSHKSKKTALVQAELGITQVREQGSVGLKCGLLAEAEADLYLHPSTGSWRWDSCAPEAVLRAAGGVLTDFAGVPYRYDGTELKNVRGMLACSQEAFDVIRPVAERVARESGLVV